MTATQPAPVREDGAVARSAPRRLRIGGRPRPWQGVIGAVIVTVIVLATLLAPWIAPYSPDAQNLLQRLQGPSASHLLGTDELGRDLLSRTLYGGRIALLVSLIAVLISSTIGIGLGLLSGFARGWVDQVLGRLADIQLALPSILLSLVVLAISGSGLTPLVVVLVVTTWPLSYRISRSHVIAVGSRPFIEAARMSGAGPLAVARRHLLPSVLPLAAVTVTLDFSTVLLLESSFGFLGLGVQPPTPDWGQMVAAGQAQLDAAWWLSVFPGVVLVVLLIGVQLLGDYLSERLSVAGLVKGARS